MAVHVQPVQRPDLGALALMVRKFGAKIEGGGYEVIVTPADSSKLSPDGTFQESKDAAGNIHWQYFPNPTIEGVGGVTPDRVTPNSVPVSVNGRAEE